MAATLVIRADAGPKMGTGHLMRCLALCDAWQAAGGQVRFATCCSVAPLLGRVRAAGAELASLESAHPDPADLQATLAVLDEAKSHDASGGPTWLALDGLHFDSDYQQAIRRAGVRLLVIDGFARLPHYHADVLLNQNLHAEQTPYTCDADTALLLGSRFALLRPEFKPWRSFRRETPDTARRLLVTLGGADPTGLTGTVIEAVGRLSVPDLEVKVIVGAANPRRDELRAEIGRSAANVELLADVADLSELMAWADVAFSAAGTTCWELALMQLPAVLTALVDNQEPIAEWMSKCGAATSLGRAEQLDADAIAQALSRLCRDRKRRATQARAGRRLIDGRGAERVVAVMRALEGPVPAEDAELRPAAAEDDAGLWRLVNDPAVRQFACASADTVPWASHVRWFRRRLASPGSRTWVLDLRGLLLGQIRYDKVDAETAEISISVTGAFRRRGLATRLIRSTWQQACGELEVRRLRANIRQENLPSVATFARAGFTRVGSQTLHGFDCRVLEWDVAATIDRESGIASE